MKAKIIAIAIASGIAIGGIFVHCTGHCPLKDAAQHSGLTK